MSHNHLPSSPGTLSDAASPVVFLVIGALLLLVGLGTAIWGLPVLAMTALTLVPVIFTLLITITLG